MRVHKLRLMRWLEMDEGRMYGLGEWMWVFDCE